MDDDQPAFPQESLTHPTVEEQPAPAWLNTINDLAPEFQLGLDRVAAALNREARERGEAANE